MGFTGAGGTEEHDVVAGGNEVEGPEVSDDVPFQAALMVVVELLESLTGGKAGRFDA
jgi:hypothetical protein